MCAQPPNLPSEQAAFPHPLTLTAVFIMLISWAWV